MGFWSTSLYSNDVTADVKDTYMNCLEYNSDDASAMAEFMEEMQEYFSTDEECLVWYELADMQWKLGRLTDDVKNRAMQSIANDESVEFFEGKSKEKWRATLGKLNLQLQQPMKPYKRIRNLRDEVAEVWEIGDIYAYQFHTEEAKKNGIYGKYILMQKVADVEGERQKVFPAMVFFDKLYDGVPQWKENSKGRILPLDGWYIEPKYEQFFPVNMISVMTYLKASEYPKKYLTYIGHEEVNDVPPLQGSRSDLSWYRMEQNWLCTFYTEWQGKEYEIVNGEYRRK